MNLEEVIYKRKSIRKYLNKDVDDNLISKINEFISTIRPLNNDIKIRFEIIEKKHVKSIFSWLSPKVIAFYSEEKEGYLENAGFMLQQLDLYLQSIGLGSCYIGLGKLDNKIDETIRNDLKYVMMLTFGYPDEEMYRTHQSFKRFNLEKISDINDERLEVARLAPSSINNQPWYFIHDKDLIHLYSANRNVFKKRSLETLLLIDSGIALAHIYISNSKTFSYFKIESPKEINGYNYLGSFKI